MGNEVVIRTYKMADDTGFAPNPFHGYLTLATCKPGIRLKAKVGEWICGFDSKKLSGSPVGMEKLVYVMKVEDKLSFDEYFEDPRFQNKKPSSGKGRVYLVGDNIYYQGTKVERRSPYHNKPEEQQKDLEGQYVLISCNFWFFGRCSIEVPPEVKPRVPKGSTYCGVKTTGAKVRAFIDWLIKNYPEPGIYGPPHCFQGNSWQKDKNFIVALCG